jgi:hypothetical protein
LDWQSAERIIDGTEEARKGMEGERKLCHEDKDDATMTHFLARDMSDIYL